MPDILHWLGVKKIDRMLSMSNMKYDAIVEQGIPILERVPIPDREYCALRTIVFEADANILLDMIPTDSRVEIDAKVNAGYFTNSKVSTEEELKAVKGRGWQAWGDVPQAENVETCQSDLVSR